MGVGFVLRKSTVPQAHQPSQRKPETLYVSAFASKTDALPSSLLEQLIKDRSDAHPLTLGLLALTPFPSKRLPNEGGA